MEKISHNNYDEAMQRVSEVLNRAVVEVKTAIDEFYLRVLNKRCDDPKPGKEISTSVIRSPNVTKPIIQGPSVSIHVDGRKPIEVGITTWKAFDRDLQELVEKSKVVARRLDYVHDHDAIHAKNPKGRRII